MKDEGSVACAKTLGVSALARARMETSMPASLAVKMTSAPIASINTLRSTDDASGIMHFNLYPFAAATNAKPIPACP